MLVHLLYGLAMLVVLVIAMQQWVILLLIASLMFLLMLALIGQPKHPQLVIERSIAADQLPSGSEFVVTLSVKNTGPRLPWLLLIEQIPKELTLLSTQTKWWLNLACGEQQQFEYRCKAERGLHQWSEVKFEVADYFGFAKTEQSQLVSNQLLVYPDWQPIGRLPLSARRLFGYAGSINAKQAGGDGDFYGVRPFVEGDSLRQVHWKVSAKQDAFFVRERNQLRNTTVNLVIDARFATNHFADHKTLFNRSLTCAASLADQCLRSGHEVAVSFIGSRSEKVPAGVGRRHFKRILSALTTAQLGHEEGLDGYQKRFFKEFGYGGSLFWISPLAQKDFTALRQLRANGFNAFVFSPNLIDSIDDETTAQVYRLKRQLLVSGMGATGIPILDWHEGQGLAELAMHLQRQRRAS